MDARIESENGSYLSLSLWGPQNTQRQGNGSNSGVQTSLVQGYLRLSYTWLPYRNHHKRCRPLNMVLRTYLHG